MGRKTKIQWCDSTVTPSVLRMATKGTGLNGRVACAYARCRSTWTEDGYAGAASGR